ncbi:MAG: helix-turn-helix transcriptional regulator, partial [Clostridia bacterium]|nr:helix-turn-helix transcriptional regulator [Clostridia bacterium]
VIAFAESIGSSQKELFEQISLRNLQDLTLWTQEDLHSYMKELLERAIELRDRESESRSKRILQKAMEYIEANYAQESLSLNKVASITNVSANYFSAMFSQVMKMTFTEYVTQKRMEQAKKLLRHSDKHSGDIALEVGYKDPHYFSFVFKKTQGCSPREYRNEASAI